MNGDSLQGWVDGLVPERGLGPKSAAVVAAVLSQPGKASYGTVHDVASISNVNVATVTRTAQALGFEGWPVFQRELRARYLSHLSAPEVAEQHAAAGSPASNSVRQDLDSLSVLSRHLDYALIEEVAAAVATAHRTYVIGDGSYGALAVAFAHNARLAGYDAESVVGGGSDIANRMAYLTSDDVVVVISFWRIYANALEAATVASEKGATVYVVTDALAPALEKVADGVITVPAEGTSFFPSLTSGISALQAIVAQLTSIDDKRSRATVAAAESQWQRFSLLFRRASGK